MTNAGEPVNTRRLSLWAAAALIAVPALAQAQAGRPVTAADLSGKTICWEDGWRITYAGGGGYLGARGNSSAANPHHERWSLLDPGVVQVDREGKQRYLQIVVLPDGRFERDRFRGKVTKGGMAGIQRSFGTVCH